MPNAPAIQRLEDRLLELGCPIVRAQSHVQEMADHHQDLRLQGLEDGLSEAEAEGRANQLLGEPVVLADRLVSVLRQSSWWGRHRVIGFCFLPPVSIFAASLLGLLLVVGFLRLCFSSNEWAVLADDGPEFGLIATGVQAACYAVTAGVAVLFCWLARRSVAGQRWALLACAMCSVQSYFGYCRIAPHAVTIGYTVAPDWIAAAIPVLVGIAAILLQPRGLRAVPDALRSAGDEAPAVLGEGKVSSRMHRVSEAWKRAVAFPTYWALAIFVCLLCFLIYDESRRVKAVTAMDHEVLTHLWPSERAVMQRKVKTHQLPSAQLRGRTINLKAFSNTTLLDEMGFPVGPAKPPPASWGNNLADLPLGRHTFGSVPFNIQGKIQLMGRGFGKFNRAFPSRVKGIRVGQKCATIHLLHGAEFVHRSSPGSAVKISALILHYSDGSQNEIGICSGRDVLDWWGPIMSTGIAPTDRETTSPETELAWVGSNPCLRASRPELSLRLYRSSFENPRPDLEVSAVDYVSTLTEAAPFLLGLTVE